MFDTFDESCTAEGLDLDNGFADRSPNATSPRESIDDGEGNAFRKIERSTAKVSVGIIKVSVGIAEVSTGYCLIWDE